MAAVAAEAMVVKELTGLAEAKVQGGMTLVSWIKCYHLRWLYQQALDGCKEEDQVLLWTAWLAMATAGQRAATAAVCMMMAVASTEAAMAVERAVAVVVTAVVVSAAAMAAAATAIMAATEVMGVVAALFKAAFVTSEERAEMTAYKISATVLTGTTSMMAVVEAEHMLTAAAAAADQMHEGLLTPEFYTASGGAVE